MKRILITGKNSYVGNNLEKWLNQYPGKYTVDKISLRDEVWKEEDFSKYDSVVHCVGLAHQKETKKNAPLYYQINRDLAFEVAKKSKKDGVGHFVFLSSMSVYGLEEGVIDENTPLRPKTNYGKSKLEAEELIKPLEDEKLRVAIIRPPMIYGKGCKGNYQRLRKLALKTPIFPNIKNKRSMIYIDNLSMYIEYIFDEKKSGIHFPQDNQFVNTTNLVKLISANHNREIYFTRLFNPVINILKLSIIKKVFGNLIYSKSIQNNNAEFIEFNESIRLTEE